MKKKVFFINFLLLAVLSFIFAEKPKIEYEVLNECEFTYHPYLHDDVLKNLNKNEILHNNNEYRVYLDEKNGNLQFIVLYDENNLEGCVDVENVKIAFNDQTAKELKNKNWIAKYAVDALFMDDVNIVFDNEGNIPEYRSEEPWLFDFDEPWQFYMQVPTLSITNVDIKIYFSMNWYIGIFTQINNNEYMSYSSSVVNGMGKYLNNLRKNESYKFTFTLDGDYLTVYLNNDFFITFVNADKNISESYLNFVTGKSYSLENITWPRHADGTCDYDNSKSTARTPAATSSAPSTPSTNVSVKKLMTTSCNLKLRAAEATSSSVLTVMAQGTKVKILELGKAETIDGISSNWVKVEVQKGAKDRDGKPIAPKTIGWCYGGYLE